MDPHSLAILEYAKVKAMLAGYAASSLGKAEATKLEPLTDPAVIRVAVEETSELRELFQSRGRLPVAGMTDVRPAIAGTGQGEAPIEPPDFVQIRNTLDAARQLKLLFEENAEALPRLAALAQRLEDFQDLCDLIDSIIEKDGTVRDDASPKLAQIRRELETVSSRLRDRAYALAASPALRALLQSDAVTLRNDRYVLAVRAECKHQIDGIILDRSQTGQTVYVEPRELVVLANELDDLRFEERREVARLLWELTLVLRDRREPMLRTLDTLALIDLTYAKARFSSDFAMSPPEINDVGVLDVRGARHPILVRVLERDGGPAQREGFSVIGYRLSGSEEGNKERLSGVGYRLSGTEAGNGAGFQVTGSGADSTGKPEASSSDRPKPGTRHPEPSSSDPENRQPTTENRPSSAPRVVPIDYRLGEDFELLVVTGPNTGGKTVALKTIGVLSLMAQSGLHVPAAPGSRFPAYTDVLADIGDEQSIEQSLSTFSAHMTNIIRILGQASQRTLILLDELGSGTDPAEGAAIGTAILDFLRSRHAKAVVTTHIGDLKAYAYHNPDALNAACEFDQQTLRPTYRLLLGQPGNSNAIAIAERLGLPEDIIRRARGLIRRRKDTATSELIAELESSRKAIEDDREKAHELHQKADALRAELEAQVRAAEEVARSSRCEAEKEIDDQLRRIRTRLAEAIRPLHNAPAPFADKAREVEASLQEEFERTPLAARRLEFARSLKRDDLVYVIPFGEKARVRSINKTKQRLQVVMGHSVIEISFDDVSWVAPPAGNHTRNPS